MERGPGYHCGGEAMYLQKTMLLSDGGYKVTGLELPCPGVLGRDSSQYHKGEITLPKARKGQGPERTMCV